MTISARTALQVPYLAVRMPLGLLDERVVVKVFGADSPAHRVLSHGLHQLDTLAAGAFGAGASSGHGSAAAPAEPQAAPRSQAPTKAQAPQAQAPQAQAPKAQAPKAQAPKAQAPARAAAPAKPAASAKPRVEEQVPQDEQQEITRLTETFVAEQELAPRAGELAEDDEIRRVQAAIKAKQAVEDERGQL